jgi:transposase
MFVKNETCKKLATIPGIGELNATILASILGTGGDFVMVQRESDTWLFLKETNE